MKFTLENTKIDYSGGKKPNGCCSDSPAGSAKRSCCSTTSHAIKVDKSCCSPEKQEKSDKNCEFN